MKFQDIDEKLEEKVDKKEFDLLKKRIEELEKLLKPQVEIVL